MRERLRERTGGTGLTGRTIVVTGASDGVGAAAARKLAGDGENVVVVGRSPDKTKAFAADMDADYFVADFSELSQVRRLADDLRDQYPRIDVLANNAGAGTGDDDRPARQTRPSRPVSRSRRVAHLGEAGVAGYQR